MNKFKTAIKNIFVLSAGAIALVSPQVSYGTIPSKVLNISTKNDQLGFDKTMLTAKANQSIKLTFKNDASKSSGLQHNWVLAKPGTADQISTASLSAGADKGWLADSQNVIAHTKLLNSGESDTIQFKAPTTPGDYPYFCTFPGHAQTMKGILKIN